MKWRVMKSHRTPKPHRPSKKCLTDRYRVEARGPVFGEPLVLWYWKPAFSPRGVSEVKYPHTVTKQFLSMHSRWCAQGLRVGIQEISYSCLIGAGAWEDESRTSVIKQKITSARQFPVQQFVIVNIFLDLSMVASFFYVVFSIQTSYASFWESPRRQ